jgi:hypothetical protein
MMDENMAVSFSECFIWGLLSLRDAVWFVFHLWELPFVDIGFDASFSCCMCPFC